jgi:dihydropteroate synthase
MGILNVTPDSFADGGRHFSLSDALDHATLMVAEGVDIIDIGGESTRPGAERVSEREEGERVFPVIEAVAKLGKPISIDTTRSAIAAEAIKLGATYVNDVSGGLADSKMYKLIAENPDVQYVIMHWRAHSKTMQELAIYEDVVKEVKDELEDRINSAIEAGVSPEQIIIDPGIGFAKSAAHNWEILRNIERFMLLGYPILIGASRKRFLGELIGSDDPNDREAATIAITAAMARIGVWAVRTHSVRPHRDAIATVTELAKDRIQ